jgi:hypothetical protein
MQSSRYDFLVGIDVSIAYKLVKGEGLSSGEEERPKLELDELEERPEIIASGGRSVGIGFSPRLVLP